MIGEELFQELNKLKENRKISKKELIIILKKYVKLISVYDLINSSAILRQGVEYVQEKYKDKFVEPYVKTFILGFNELSNQNENINGYVDNNLFIDSVENLEYNFYKETDLKRKNSKFPLIITLSSLYVTFIKQEPLHPVGSVFPGNFEVYKEDGVFYCPVKDAQKDNPNALCIFCLAEQTPNVH